MGAMSDKELEAGADKLLALAERDGIVISSVKDGHVMVFTKAYLLGILGKMEAAGQTKAVVFMRRPSAAN
jgi:hypothetical protein